MVLIGCIIKGAKYQKIPVFAVLCCHPNEKYFSKK